jgi:hypothetical protein
VVFLQGSQYVHAFFLYYLFISVLLLEIQLSKAVVIPLTDLKPIQAIIWICISIFHGSCGTVALYGLFILFFFLADHRKKLPRKINK